MYSECKSYCFLQGGQLEKCWLLGTDLYYFCIHDSAVVSNAANVCRAKGRAVLALVIVLLEPQTFNQGTS